MGMPLQTATAAPDSDPSVRAVLRRFVFGPHGIRAGWRLLMFLVIALPLILLAQRITKMFPTLRAAAKLTMEGGAGAPLGEIVVQLTALLPILAAAWIMSRVERRPFRAYGLPLSRGAGRRFVHGAFWGLATEAFTILLIFACRGYSVGGLALHPEGIAKYATLWAIAFLLVGLQEEFLFRGYMLSTLASGIRFWPAAIVTSLLFGAAHMGNPSENWIGVLGIVAWALVVCLAIRRTGTLWFAVGLHASDDFAQTFVFSVNDSGAGAQGQLLHTTLHGPAWLTGGTVGPEGSVFALLATLLLAVAVNFLYRGPATTPSFQSDKALS